MSCEKPILFSAPMVRAILEGKKNQTRRLFNTDYCVPLTGEILRWPYGHPGDRLWVRETWRHQASPHTVTSCRYRADETPENDHYQWRPSIFMPRWASRITLEVTGVRVERLQEISEADALAEGFPLPGGPMRVNGKLGTGVFFDPLMAFRAYWHELNAKRCPWESNPWVWVVTFEMKGG